MAALRVSSLAGLLRRTAAAAPEALKPLAGSGASGSRGWVRTFYANSSRNPEEVIRSFESGSLGFTEEATKEYVKALVAVDRLTSRPSSAPSGGPHRPERGGRVSGLRSRGGVDGGAVERQGPRSLGTPSAPVHVTQAEPSFRARSGAAWSLGLPSS